jgi:hypothetical protein
MASSYFDTDGKRKLRITNSKGDGYLWSDVKRLWLKTESIYVRNSISNSIRERVNNKILSTEEL